MSSQRPVAHRTFIDRIPMEHDGRPVALHIATYSVAELRRAYPSGQFRCGSCGEVLEKQRILDDTEERWGPDTVITLALSHDYFPIGFFAQDQTPVGEAQSPAQGPVLYSDGVREEYINDGDGRYERLYGIVFRDARSPGRMFRELWYPTGVFRAAEEGPNAEA